MAARIEEILDEIRRVADEAEPQRTDLLRKRLSHKQPLVVLAVVKVVRAKQLVSLATDVAIVFDKLIATPASDPGCTVKQLILETLKDFDAVSSDILHRAVRHHQIEPVWGGSVDTAAHLRAWAAYRLGETGDAKALPALCELLFEQQSLRPAPDEVAPRIAAARVLGQYRHDVAALLLRAKLLSGDRSDEVIGEALGALFCTGIDWAEALVDEHFTTLTDDARAAAAISIGEQRSVRAASLLLKHWPRAEHTEAAESWMLGLALTRQECAIEFLLEQIRHASAAYAQFAVRALEQFNNESIRVRMVAAAGTRDDDAVRLKS